MTRIRITLLLLALGIGLPATLLVLRAVESLELENAYRHEAVAERVFDEMERSLSDFLLREEPRPPSDYDLGLPRDGSPTSVSPVFRAADEPFIVGWFSLDSGGETRLHASRTSDEARIKSAVEAALGPRDKRKDSRRVASPSAAGVDEDELAPGRTKATGKARLEKKALAAADEQMPAESTAYDVLQELNRAQSLRSERQSKARREGAPAYGSSTIASAPAPAPARVHARPEAGAEAEVDAVRPRFEDAAKESVEAFVDLAEEERFEVAESIDDASGSRSLRARRGASAASVDPLIGRLTDAGDIVLTRSVWRNERVDRQGLVLDRAALVVWLRDRVLSETGLAERAHVDFATPDLPPRAEADHRYLHRFAEPFDGLVARLDLDPLAGVGSARPIYALALLLFVVGTIGLFAVDRMTRVVIEYAERRSNFVAAVSHELKTPLTSIRMYGEMLRDGLVGSEEKRAEYYETITGESERLSRLIDNVLEFSRLEQDRRDLDLVVGGLPETVREAAEKLRTHVEREGFALQLDLAETLPRVRYDRDAITQILFNLVDNALKYARGAERREVWIRLADENGHVELSVRDFGLGVASDQLHRIFEPFYRIGEELTRTTEGTGIGLALVKELVEKSGGRVHASSPKDGGFAVTIEFDLDGPDENPVD
jgi:signal transduction histidine kinase